MKIVERTVGDIIILDLHGKILIGEGDDALREAVTKLVDSGAEDPAGTWPTPYVDSAGLARSSAATRPSAVRGRAPEADQPDQEDPGPATSPLLTVFETYESEDEAVKSF